MVCLKLVKHPLLEVTKTPAAESSGSENLIEILCFKIRYFQNLHNPFIYFRILQFISLFQIMDLLTPVGKRLNLRLI